MTGSASTSVTRVNACAQNCQRKKQLENIRWREACFGRFQRAITLGLVWFEV